VQPRGCTSIQDLQEAKVKIDSLSTLLEEELRDIYDAEKRLVKALPKMAKAASSNELKHALQEHLEVTKGQVARLEEVFENLGVPAKARACAGMKGLIEEGEEVMDKNADTTMMDAAIIAAAQRVEHYEIAAYGTVRTFAERLGNDKVVELLQQTLDEEKETDEKLTQISEQLLEDAGESDVNEIDESEMDESEEEATPRATGNSRRGAKKTAATRTSRA
jgi:ferritin-like metal-binding protein YciE